MYFLPVKPRLSSQATVSTCSFDLIRYSESVRWKIKKHYFINSILVIYQRALLYADICFEKTVKWPSSVPEGYLFPHTEGAGMEAAFWSLHEAESCSWQLQVQVALSYRHWKDPPGWTENKDKIKHRGQTFPFWQAFQELRAPAGSQGEKWGKEAGLGHFPAEYLHHFIFSTLELFLSKSHINREALRENKNQD